MKNGKYLIVLAICLLLLSSCGSVNEDLNGNMSEGISTQENLNSDKDYTVITSFYDFFVELGQLNKDNQYELLNEKILKSQEIIESFEKRAKECDLKYQTYFESMINNPMYDLYKSTFVSDDKYILNTSIEAMAYVYLFENCVSSILEQKLPFDYVTQQQESEDKEKEEAYKKVVEMINSARKEGLDIVYNPGDISYASYADSVVYDVGGKIYYSIGFEFPYSKNGIDFYLILNSMEDEVFYNIDTLTISNGLTSVKYNSTQMYNSGFGMTSLYFYHSSFGKEMNENYEQLRNMLNDSNNITLTINNDIVLNLTETDVTNLKQYTALFDVVRMIYEGI